MNTFAFVGDLEGSPEVSCVYHSEEAENQVGARAMRPPCLCWPLLTWMPASGAYPGRMVRPAARLKRLAPSALLKRPLLRCQPWFLVCRSLPSPALGRALSNTRS